MKTKLKLAAMPAKPTKTPAARDIAILDRFPEEQRIQIRRLTRDLFEAGGSGNVDETITMLAAAALFVFGMDALGQDDFDRVSSVVFSGDGDDVSNIVTAVINEFGGQRWTREHRDGEGAKAEEAGT